MDKQLQEVNSQSEEVLSIARAAHVMKITPSALRKLLKHYSDIADKYSVWKEVRGKQARHFTKAGLIVLANMKDGNRRDETGEASNARPNLPKQVLAENQLELLKALPEIMARLSAMESKFASTPQITHNKFALPVPTVAAIQLTDRDKVRSVVYDYSQAKTMPVAYVWTHLYSQFYYRCKVNITARAKRMKKDKLDIIEELGLMPQLYAIACEILI